MIKPKPNKQHDVRGASFLRIAKRLRANAKVVITAGQQQVLLLIAEAFEAEAKNVRRLR